MTNYSDGEQVKDVYANFGLAIYAVQCLEHELVNDFIYLDLIPREMPEYQSKDWEQRVDDFASKHFKEMLGRMIGHLKDVTDVSLDLSEKLSAALKMRNWLVHDYFKERSMDFLSSDGRSKMILELQHATSLIHEADELLSLVLIPIKKKHGITEESITRISEEMLKQSKNNV